MQNIAVIIPCLNRTNLLKRSLTSVINQSRKANQVYIIDDGSSQNIISSIPVHYSLNFIRTQKNKGVSAARNIALKKALKKNDWISFLDSDDEWLPTKLEKQEKFILENPNIKIFQTDEIWIRNDKRVNPQKQHLKQSGNIFEASLERCMITPSSVIIHKSLFEKYGLFDVELKACEDYDLWLRMSANNSIGLLNEKLLIRYQGHGDQLSLNTPILDRFRVHSLNKLLYKDYISKAQQQLILQTLLKKIGVIIAGAQKRNNYKIVSEFENILNNLKTIETKQIEPLL